MLDSESEIEKKKAGKRTVATRKGDVCKLVLQTLRPVKTLENFEGDEDSEGQTFPRLAGP